MMTNREYIEANRPAFKQFVANNIAEFRSDKSHLLNCLEYYAHCFGAGMLSEKHDWEVDEALICEWCKEEFEKLYEI